MFDWLTAESILELARPVARFLMGEQARLTHKLWAEYPVLMTLSAVVGAIGTATYLWRRIGCRVR